MMLAGLAVAVLAGSGGPARVRAASGTTRTAGASGPAAGAEPGARTYPPGNPNPSAHPNTINGPAAPPVDPALTLGRADAPVTIVEFGDYQCTNRGAFARGTESALVRKYVDPGVVRLVWRDFPWVDAQSVASAVAARAAGMQGKFWRYHDYLFAHQSPDEHSGLVTGAYLRSVARLGLNMALFNRDMAGPTLAAAVRADKQFGEGLGVPGTLAFLINGRPLFGAQPLPAFEAAIARPVWLAGTTGSKTRSPRHKRTSRTWPRTWPCSLRGGSRGDRRRSLAAAPRPARRLHWPAATCRGASLCRTRHWTIRPANGRPDRARQLSRAGSGRRPPASQFEQRWPCA